LEEVGSGLTSDASVATQMAAAGGRGEGGQSKEGSWLLPLVGDWGSSRRLCRRLGNGMEWNECKRNSVWLLGFLS